MVSVVIPVYNIEKWLWQCVESVISQTYADLQIILVDDGSTDLSGKICDEYAANDSRIEVIHKENGGLSDARNAGTEIAKGEYIYYLDGDDWLDKDAIKTAVQFSYSHDCDVIQSGHWYASSDYLGFDKEFLSQSQQPFVLNRVKAMRQLILNNYLKNFAWGKLYRTGIVKKHPFPVGKYFEDSFWQHLIIDESSNVGIIPQPYYFYRQRTESISSVVSVRNFDLIRGMDCRMSFINEHYPELYKLCAKRFWKSVWLLKLGVQRGPELLRAGYDSFENVLIDKHKRCHDKLLWNSYRYFTIRYAHWLLPFISFCERVYDHLFLPYLQVGCSKYDSVADIFHTLDKYGVNYKVVGDKTRILMPDFLESSAPSFSIICDNENDVVEALRLSGYSTDSRKWDRHDNKTVVRGKIVRIRLQRKTNE